MAIDFKRSFYDKMLDWKAQWADKYALLVEGARRVGKTHLVTHFVKQEYETCVYIDFSSKGKEVRECKRAFEEESAAEDIVERLKWPSARYSSFMRRTSAGMRGDMRLR